VEAIKNFNREESTPEEIAEEQQGQAEYPGIYQKFIRMLGLDRWVNQAPGPETPVAEQDWPLNNLNVMGLPPGFIPSTDPGDRYFNNVMLQRPPIMSLVPGTASIRTRLLPFGRKRGQLKAIAALAERADNDEEATRQLAAIIATNRSKNEEPPPSLLLYEFKRDYAQYYKYVNAMMASLAVMMDTPAGGNSIKDRYQFRLNDNFEPGLDRGLAFWVEKSSSVSESASNTFTSGDPMEAMRKKGTQIARSFNYAAGTERVDPDVRLKDASNMLSMNNTVGKITGVTGTTMVFQSWDSSQYSKDLSLSFKFISPYGDPASIFEFVYKPFICLLALTLPKQSATDAYTTPFLVRVDCPGWFTCDMGAITSLTFKKGGSEDMWTVDGLPRVIEVTVNIQDMYPALMQSRTSSMIATNPSMQAFLMNMAGVRSADPFESSAAKNKMLLAARAQYLDINGLVDRFGIAIGDTVARFVDNYAGIYGFLQNTRTGF
jgi:hypothetical protein